jgi:serine/threonine protein kinase
MLKHPNNLVMKDSYLTKEGEEEYLNIVMDYFSDNLYQVVKKKELNPLLVKIYTYQIIRGLNYLSMLSIAHRDIKPQNILVDRIKHKVILSDFGSAKQLVKSKCATI